MFKKVKSESWTCNRVSLDLNIGHALISLPSAHRETTSVLCSSAKSFSGVLQKLHL